MKIMSNVSESEQDNIETKKYDSDEIASILETDIVFGYLHPCQRLVETNLQSRFNTTRHVIRQSIAKLVSLGIVEYKKNIGAMVKSYNREEVINLYDLRTILETSAAERIEFPVSQKALRQLKNIQKKHDKAISDKDREGVFRANIMFHRTLFALSGNNQLTMYIEECARKAHVIRFRSVVDPNYLQLAQSEHHEMIKALVKGDRSQLVALCAKHLIPSRDAYLNVL